MRGPHFRSTTSTSRPTPLIYLPPSRLHVAMASSLKHLLARPPIHSPSLSCIASRILILPASHRCFSILNRPPPNYKGHIPLTKIERGALAIGSTLLSFRDPRCGGMPCLLYSNQQLIYTWSFMPLTEVY